ncbi:MAG: hypothetical protein J2P46_17270 [Zavarzinella sp.]|nr:hypothetical protein [Zavarzinella sp.]
MTSAIRPGLEPLEARDVPSATLANGVLTVTGTDKADDIAIARVVWPGTLFVRVVENGQPTEFPSFQVHRVRVFGNGGDDRIANYVGGLNAVLYGGSGNDTLQGGGGNDTLAGGTGKDKLYGGAGFDHLYGGPGSDWLDAGSPGEPVFGGTGYDFNAQVWAYNGARPADIRQPASHTDAFLASLAAVAHTGRVDLARQISYAGEDTFTVRLFAADGSWTDVAVTFNGDVTADATGVYDCLSGREGEFWPLLYQRAYLMTLGYDPSSPESVAAFPGEPDSGRALTAITGSASRTVPVDADTGPKQLSGLVRDDHPVTATSGGHEYAVTNVFRSGGTWYVRLFDPSGENQRRDAHPLPDRADDGYLTVTWSNFTTAFSQYSYA